MKKLGKILSLLLAVCVCLSVLAACGQGGDKTTAPAENVDYAASVKLDMSSDTLKQEVAVHLAAPDLPEDKIKYTIDGDTTHFEAVKKDGTPQADMPDGVGSDGVFKARYLAINTPESTGKVEPYGRAASNFTHEKLKNAVSIVIESDTAVWNPDSTGSRYLVWVWYKTSADAEYRNLNIEILQNGLALASNSADNRYGEVCMKAIAQAENNKLNVYSGQQDPNFYYGQAVELTLKELRANIASYEGVSVAFTGIVTRNSGMDGVYVEALDEETGMYNGMYVYYGTSADADLKDEVLVIGKEVRIVGVVSIFNGSYQVSGLKYDARDKANSCRALSEGHKPAYLPTAAEDFVNGKVEVTVTDSETGEETLKELSYAEMALGSSVSLQGLEVTSVYTTDNGGSSDGAMTLTCQVNGITITVRTNVLRNADGSVVTQDLYEGQTISVQGIVEFYNGAYQIKVLSVNDIIIH